VIILAVIKKKRMPEPKDIWHFRWGRRGFKIVITHQMGEGGLKVNQKASYI